MLPINLDTKTDDELEQMLKKLENDKTEIQKILADRKRDACVICLIGICFIFCFNLRSYIFSDY